MYRGSCETNTSDGMFLMGSESKGWKEGFGESRLLFAWVVIDSA